VIVVADAGPLIALGKLGRLDLLQSVADTVLVPPAVVDEVVVAGERRGRADAIAVRQALRTGLVRSSPAPKIEVPYSVDLRSLGLGEREAIQLALNEHADAVLIDDMAARAAASELGLTVFGTLGIVVRALHADAIQQDEAADLLRAIQRRPDIWISAELIDRALAGLSDA
jgi:predicted nucleic acid-binding protein